MQVFGLSRTSWLRLDAAAFTATLGACSGPRLWARAEALLDELWDGGIRPSAVTCNAALGADSAASRWERALGLAAKAGQASLHTHVAGEQGRSTRRKEQLATVWNPVLGACAAGAQWSRSLAMLRVAVLQQLEQDLVAFNIALTAGARGGQWWHALRAVKTVANEGLAADAITLSAAVAALDRGEDRAHWRHITLLLGEMAQRRLSLNRIACSAAMSAFNAGRAWRAALGFSGRLVSQHGLAGADVAVLAEALDAVGTAGLAGESASGSELRQRASSILREIGIHSVDGLRALAAAG